MFLATAATDPDARDPREQFMNVLVLNAVNRVCTEMLDIAGMGDQWLCATLACYNDLINRIACGSPRREREQNTA
jgi:hypothetical protein